ncbi:hypothetical protein SORBI_3002G242650 [Sorghum bicolor]|uniref:Uncharacterized protein n=2 Tax=Sorghum bicolor TaxID=4558 RepID=A0A1W0W5Q4_SORBI|nr:hypothetical protein SORBI_3002G242650 [Sorghum bicolor]
MRGVEQDPVVLPEDGQRLSRETCCGRSGHCTSRRSTHRPSSPATTSGTSAMGKQASQKETTQIYTQSTVLAQVADRGDTRHVQYKEDESMMKDTAKYE